MKKMICKVLKFFQLKKEKEERQEGKRRETETKEEGQHECAPFTSEEVAEAKRQQLHKNNKLFQQFEKIAGIRRGVYGALYNDREWDFSILLSGKGYGHPSSIKKMIEETEYFFRSTWSPGDAPYHNFEKKFNKIIEKANNGQLEEAKEMAIHLSWAIEGLYAASLAATLPLFDGCGVNTLEFLDHCAYVYWGNEPHNDLSARCIECRLQQI